MIIGIFAGSRSGKIPGVYEAMAYSLGVKLAKSGFGVAFGGSNSGLMHQMALGVKKCKGKLLAFELIREGWGKTVLADKVFQYEDLHLRQHDFITTCDAYIALPGGCGSLFEIAQVLCLKDIGDLADDTPIICLDSDYWCKLSKLLHQIVERGFAFSGISKYIDFVDSADDAVSIVERFRQNKNTES